MLRLIGLIGTAAAIMSVASGCTWQQAYLVGQQWQRNACNRLIDQTERDRCLSNSNMAYEDYRRHTEGAKKDQGMRRGTHFEVTSANTYTVRKLGPGYFGEDWSPGAGHCADVYTEA